MVLTIHPRPVPLFYRDIILVARYILLSHFPVYTDNTRTHTYTSFTINYSIQFLNYYVTRITITSLTFRRSKAGDFRSNRSLSWIQFYRNKLHLQRHKIHARNLDIYPCFSRRITQLYLLLFRKYHNVHFSIFRMAHVVGHKDQFVAVECSTSFSVVNIINSALQAMTDGDEAMLCCIAAGLSPLNTCTRTRAGCALLASQV